MYVIVDGEGEVLVEDEAVPPRVVALLTKGDFFGEASLLTGESRNATVKAKTDLEVLTLTKGMLMPIVERRPDLAEKFAEIMEERSAKRKQVLKEKKAEHESSAQRKASLTSKIRKWFLA